MRRPVRQALLALPLTACTAQAPEYQPPQLDAAVPEDWLAREAAGEVTQAWWLTFGDPRLAGLVAEALRNNNDLAAAAARVEIAAARARIEGARLEPQADLGVAASRRRTNASSLGAMGGDPFTVDSYGVSLDVSWEVDLWGRLRSRASAALADLQAREAAYAGAALSLAAQTAKAWYALTEARLQTDLADETARAFRRSVALVDRLVKAGVQPDTELHLARANAASAEAQLRDSQAAMRRAARQLEALLGRYPAGELKGAESLPEVDRPVAAGLPAEALRRRPDLLRAERRVAAASERIDAAEAAMLPRLTLTTSAGTATGALGSLLSGQALVWTIAGNLVQPLLTGGRLEARVDVAEGRLREASEAYAEQALQAFTEVESALSVEELLAERQAALRRAAGAARQAVNTARLRYQRGVEPFLTVLEAQRRAYEASSQLLSVRFRRLDNRINLHLALGDGVGELMARAPTPKSAEAG